MSDRQRVKAAKRWVVKVGSALLTRDGQGLDREVIQEWVGQMAALKGLGVELVLVSSGSIAEGMSRLGWRKRPAALYELQAAAAVGQMGIAQVYESAFQCHGLHTAQILLTHDDVSNRARYLNARSTLEKLLALDVVPVVNENDTVSTEAIRLGDNDTLAGLVCNLVQAELFVILTDQQGLYSADPRVDSKATFISDGRAGDGELRLMAGNSGRFGQGGMRTKLRAAELAGRSGTPTIIASGHEREVLSRIAAGEKIGTLLSPSQAAITARKQWLAGQLKVRGTLSLDAGAADVLKRSGRSLLAVGVKAVTGDFARGELVACLGPDDREVARGLVNYDAAETRKIKGVPSGRIFELLGYVDEPELIHRDNLVLTGD